MTADWDDTLEGGDAADAADGPAPEVLPDEEVLGLIRARGRRGLTMAQLVAHVLAARGGSRSELRRDLRRAVRRLERAAAVVVGRGKRYFTTEASDLAAGRLRTGPGGLLLVDLEGVRGQPVAIPPRRTRGALPGDRVMVRLERTRRDARDRGLGEGVVVRVLERARRTLVGRWTVAAGGRPHVRPFDRRVRLAVWPSLPSGVGEPEDGELVVVSLDEVSERGSHARGTVIERLGAMGDPGIEERVVIRLFELEEEFTPEVRAEVERIVAGPATVDLTGRTDLRGEPAITIDPVTARDFDDAVSARPGPDGAIEVAVHIADVAHFVCPGSLLDDAARSRGTSVYFPGRCLPMLPEQLSGDLCSLRPEVDRQAMTVRFSVRPDGEVRRPELVESVIRSRRRCTYGEVFGWLETPADRWPAETAGFAESLRLVSEAADRLGRARRARGSLDFDLSEPELLLDPEGRVTSVQASARNRAHRLIEELMVAANQVVARRLEEESAPALYRAHDAPDPARLEELAVLLGELGHRLPAAEPRRASPGDLQAVLERIAGRPEERLLATLVLRSLARASYSPRPRGHYALATDDYLHFTSPIRRYPDLVVHRAVKAVLRGEGRERLPSGAALDALALSTTAAEQRAEAAEREVIRWKTLVYLADRVGEIFDGVITGVTSFGVFVELAEVMVDGLIHVADLGDDYYHHDERRHQLVGEGSGRRLRLGDAIRVRLIRVDLEALQTQLLPVDVRPQPPRGARRGGRRRRG